MPFIPSLDPQIYVLVGEPRSGKSTLIKSLMHYWAQKKLFKFGLVLTGSKWNEDFDFLPKNTVWEGYDEERFKEYINALQKRAEMLKEKGKKLPRSFIIFDDLLGELKNSDFFKSLIARFRHFNLTVLLATQYLADKGSSTLLRQCTDVSFMFPTMMANSVDAMHKAWGGYYKTSDEFKEKLMEVKKTKFACLLYQKEFDNVEECYCQLVCNPAPKNFNIKFESIAKNNDTISQDQLSGQDEQDL